jgi:pimeloyl-ACP methyl ester carboxylesterase
MKLKGKGFVQTFLVLVAGVSLLMAAPGQSAEKYQWQAVDLSFQNQGMNIVCTLTTPNIKRSRPIVLILHGYGGERTGFPVEGTGEGYFERFARILAERGYCSLRIDFRGSGESDGGYEVTTFEGQVSDAMAAIDFIQGLPDPVDPTKIAVVGHSQGGAITSLLSARDKRVDTAVLWGAVSAPAHDYEGLITKDGMKQGLALADGEFIALPLYVDGVDIGLTMSMSKQFFVDLFSVDPLVAIKDYKGPLLYVAGLGDIIVWPQPIVGQNFMNAHEGEELLVSIDMGHNFNHFIGPGKLDEQIDVTIDFIRNTLKK